MAGTGTAKKLPIQAIGAMIDDRTKRPLVTTRPHDANDLRAVFRDNQIPAKIAMLDTDAAGVALIAQTGDGYLIRIALTEAECLDMARTLLAKVRVG